MQSFPIVIDFYIAKKSCFCFISGGKDGVSTAFFLHCCPEAFHHRVLNSNRLSRSYLLAYRAVVTALDSDSSHIHCRAPNGGSTQLQDVDSAQPSVTPFLLILCHVASPLPIQQLFENRYQGLLRERATLLVFLYTSCRLPTFCSGHQR